EPSRSTAFLAMEKIRQAGGNISFDPNIRSDLWQSEALLRKYLDRALSLANIAKLSEEELLFISGESQVQQGAYSLVQRYSLTLLLITQGKNGVLVYFQGQFIHYPAKPVSVVDTTGAGDAFVAGLLAGLADSGIPTNTRQLERIIAQAQICGALATTAKGAITALPRQHDLPSQ
ncbi:PfkB family carbohydrate kinase, partial [Escherichia coli]